MTKQKIDLEKIAWLFTLSYGVGEFERCGDRITSYKSELFSKWGLPVYIEKGEEESVEAVGFGDTEYSARKNLCNQISGNKIILDYGRLNPTIDFTHYEVV